jgi:hypothetical protein
VDGLGVGVDSHTQLSDQMPVDGDTACADEILAGSPAAHPGRCQELLQAHTIGVMDIDPACRLLPLRG